MAIIDGTPNNDNGTVNGGGFRPTLVGTAVNDTIFGRRGNDVLIGLQGDDVLLGGRDRDTLLGGTGNDYLLGEKGDDVLFGDDGDDVIVGGDGYDILTGGAGADQFFRFSPQEGPDLFTDFTPGQDTFVVSTSGFGGVLTTGSLAANEFVVGTAAVDDSTRFIYNNTTGELLFDPDGIGPAAQELIATLSTDLSLGSSDFSIIDNTQIPLFPAGSGLEQLPIGPTDPSDSSVLPGGGPVVI